MQIENDNDNEYDELDDTSNDSSVVREDKIFNNRYNTGDGLPDTDDYQFSRQITASSDYSESYLKDLYDYEDRLEHKFILDDIFKFIYSDEELSKIIINPTQLTHAKIKLTKDQVNFIFNKVNGVFEKLTYQTAFYNPIYILEAISAISSIEYKKLFDMFDSDIQEILILELNKKYLFLEGRVQKKRIQ